MVLFFGFNISILAGLFTLIFSRLLGRWRGAALVYLAWPFVVYTIRVVEGLSGIPDGAISLGNLPFDEMESLGNGLLVRRVSALLLADSGYAPLTSPEWVANLQPQVVLLSVSLKDVTGLPSPETLKAVEGYTLLRTDRNGWIELSTDGEQMWVEAAR